MFTDKELAYSVLWTFVRTLSTGLRETNEKIWGFFCALGALLTRRSGSGTATLPPLPRSRSRARAARLLLGVKPPWLSQPAT